SFGPFLQTGNDLSTTCLLVNLQARPGFDESRVSIATLRERLVLKEVRARRNSCTAIDLSDLAEQNDGLLCVYSRDMTGIPIYLSHDRDFRHLSLEHSHPPAELVIFGNRNQVQGRMKSWWLDNLGSCA
ncbi:MAG: hypothetical protein RIB59_11465, partial [Rhodospirillales bacterium]